MKIILCSLIVACLNISKKVAKCSISEYLMTHKLLCMLLLLLERPRSIFGITHITKTNNNQPRTNDIYTVNHNNILLKASL